MDEPRTITFRLPQKLLSQLDAHVLRMSLKAGGERVSRESVLRSIVAKYTRAPRVSREVES